MPKRKSPSKKESFALPLLTKSVFKRPNDSASSRPGSSPAQSEPSTTPSQNPIAPTATHTSFPTPHETPSTKLQQFDHFGLIASVEGPGSSHFHPAPPPGISQFVIERQLNQMSEKVEAYTTQTRESLKQSFEARDINQGQRIEQENREDVETRAAHEEKISPKKQQVAETVLLSKDQRSELESLVAVKPHCIYRNNMELSLWCLRVARGRFSEDFRKFQKVTIQNVAESDFPALNHAFEPET
ncbi:hypothetical protein BDV93DRAFT_542543 [Ceratobasidium sp. AG-I]|nr:hypothetical protein BDV93DRAFT_542543 [Ceratobasidium sp. AG-I]